MANKLLLKKSSVAAKIPTTADLDYGELALNYADGKLYYKDSTNAIQSFVSGTGSAAVTSVAGNTGDVTATQLLNAVVTVDGAGSGLDADLLDGFNSSTTDVASTVVVRDVNKFIGISGINLSTNDVDAPSIVQMKWNITDSTWEYQLKNNVTLQVGQELHFYGRATENIANGDVIMFAGAQGDGILISKSNVNVVGFHPSWIVGIATQDILINEWGYVTWFGKINNVDTFGYNLGDILYLDPTVNGGFTVTQPTAPNAKIRLASVVRVATALNADNGILMVRPEYAEKLSDLQDVQITSIANGDLISWNATNNRWENKAQSTLLAGDSDKLDNQHGSYYLDWTNTTNKPDPVITVTLAGDVTGTANTTLTDLASGTISVTTSIAANSVALGTDTIGDYAASVAVSGIGLSVTGTAGEGTAFTVNSLATTIGGNLFTLANPSATTFPRFNADNTVTALDAIDFRAAIGAGTSSTTGTVTSVAALTIGSAGSDISSSVVAGTTAPVITLNVPTASATNRGALSAADWTTFNSKTNNTGTVTSVGTSGPLTGGTITTSGTIGIQVANISQDGYLTSTDWNAFTSKQDLLVSGTSIKTINGTSVLGSGDLVVTGGSATLDGLTDVVITTPSDGQVLSYDNASSAWVNTAPTGGGGALSGYSATIGDATNVSFTVTHNLNKTNIYVSVREISSGYFVYPDIRYTSANTLDIELATAPTVNQYTVAVIGF